jgi:hypothetical protein
MIILHAPGTLAAPLLVLISVATFFSFVVTFCNEIFTSKLWRDAFDHGRVFRVGGWVEGWVDRWVER